MKRYKSFTANTGVTGYESGRDYIRVRFRDRSIYRYTYRSTGAVKIEEMKRLAEEGDGHLVPRRRLAQGRRRRKAEGEGQAIALSR